MGETSEENPSHTKLAMTEGQGERKVQLAFGEMKGWQGRLAGVWENQEVRQLLGPEDEIALSLAYLLL